MREILFRGKRLNNGEWVEGFYNHLPCGRFGADEHMIQTVLENGKIGMLYDIDPSTVGQYTGLKDKNGKRIFEGDIVRFAERRIGGEDVSIVEPVAFDEGGFCTYRYFLNNWMRSGNAELEGIEVIGNIHDNPELLEG